jgi:diaminohydroxyphosphoribosylaminopyrimidine deaminase / 5-amino-6-(5-phosphoribosylamino)uracil reductase
MTVHEKFMQRCLDLALAGEGSVAPNPMAGCVIVCENKIIGEGFHRQFGGPHAEVFAVNAVINKELFASSTLYVSLEPCSHSGKTPPCTELIIGMHIPRVVIGMSDPFHLVAGKGIERLKNAGIITTTGILEKQCRWINRRFLTFHLKKRPYIILKWAQTMDGFIDEARQNSGTSHSCRISGSLAHLLVHRQRTLEDAVLVGTRTALNDNPELTAREWSGKNPVRLVIDRKLKLPGSLKLMDQKHKTIVFNEIKSELKENISLERIDFEGDVLTQILDILFSLNIQSLVVEGGAYTLQGFIDRKIWDEAHIYTGDKWFFSGLKAPAISGGVMAVEQLEDTVLTVVYNEEIRS